MEEKKRLAKDLTDEELCKVICICPKCGEMSGGAFKRLDGRIVAITKTCESCGNDLEVYEGLSEKEFDEGITSGSTYDARDKMWEWMIKYKPLEEYDQKLIEERLQKMEKADKIWQQQQLERQRNKPKCPICGSYDLTKLSTMGKAAKVGLFGLFGAGDIGKTYKCNNCGSKF